jgi:hypothetical protein
MGEKFRIKISEHKHPSCWIPECSQLEDSCDYNPDSVDDCPRRKQFTQDIQKEVKHYPKVFYRRYVCIVGGWI